MASMSPQFLDELTSFLEPLQYELIFAGCFLVGWTIVNKLQVKDRLVGRLPDRRGRPRTSGHEATQLADTIKAAFSEGRSAEVVAAWQGTKHSVALEPEALRMVVWALAREEPELVVEDLTQYLAAHRSSLCTARTAVVVMEALASTGKATELLDQMHEALSQQLELPFNYQVCEILLGSHAAAGHVERVQGLAIAVRDLGQKLTARGHALIIKGFVQNGLLEPALQQAHAMRNQGFFVPPFALGQLFKLASQASAVPRVLAALTAADVALPAEALEAILEDCARRGDAELAKKAEGLLYAVSNNNLSQASFGCLLKAKVGIVDVQALEMLEEVWKMDFSDAFFASLMNRCAAPKFLRFAEELASGLRARRGMSMATYSALMKVYALCGSHGKACDLYEELLARGLEPDAVTTSCVMRFALEAGRLELLARLSEKDPSSMRGYMLRIRAAGKSKDVEGVFAILEKMRANCFEVDSMAYNVVLDACVNAGDLDRARATLSTMLKAGQVDVISFNTMLKGYSACGDMRGSQELFAEMSREGIKPDEVSYNCMINAAVKSGNVRLAWDMSASMEQAGVPMDTYTVSTLLKTLKGQSISPSDVKSALALLDRVGIDACTSDPVLFNVALEACCKHRDWRRLQGLIAAWEQSSLQPSTYTYAALIKAYSALHRLDKCQRLWKQMTGDRGVTPSDILLGCMLDALVSNGKVTEAVDLLQEWKGKVEVNMIMYSTLVKGFAIAGRAEEAMQLWRDLRAEKGLALNVVVYNALMDAQARAGSMDSAHELLASMEGDGVVPDGITHSTMMKGYCTIGDLDNAFELFRRTQKAGLATDCVVYNTLLDSCTKHNRADLADQVFADFEASGIRASNFTLGILIKMYGRRKQLQKAFEVLNGFAAKHRLVPNLQARSCLMSVCISNNALDRGLELYDAIKRDSEGQVDSRTLDNVLSGLMRAGRLLDCIHFVEEAYGLTSKEAKLLPPGQHLSAQSLERLFQTLSMKGLRSQGSALQSCLRAQGVCQQR